LRYRLGHDRRLLLREQARINGLGLWLGLGHEREQVKGLLLHGYRLHGLSKCILFLLGLKLLLLAVAEELAHALREVPDTNHDTLKDALGLLVVGR
jgi:hypothetical protein